MGQRDDVQLKRTDFVYLLLSTITDLKLRPHCIFSSIKRENN